MTSMTDICKLSADEVIRLMTNLQEIRLAVRYIYISDEKITSVFNCLKKDIKQNYEVCKTFLKMSPKCFDLIPEINRTEEMHLMMFNIHKIFKPMTDKKKNETFCTKLISKGKFIEVDRDMKFRYSLFVKKYVKYVGRDIFSLPRYQNLKWNQDYYDTYKRDYDTFLKLSKWPFDIRIEYKYSKMLNIINCFLFILN